MSLFELFAYGLLGIFIFLMIMIALGSGDENKRYTTSCPPPRQKKDK